MTDGPLIVQSDKTLLLEVDHPTARATRGRRSRRSPSWSARPSTCTPTGSPRWRCGTRAPPGTTPSRWSTRWSASPATRCRSRCWSTSSTRWTATAGCSWPTHPVHGLVLHRLDRAVLEEVLRHKKIAPMLGARIDDDTVVVHPSRARPAQAGAAQGRLAGRGPGRLRRRRGAPDRRWPRTAGSCATTSERPSRAFWAGGSGVVVLPCGAGKTLVGAAAMAEARRDHADPGHQHRRRPAVEARADRPHVADRGGDRRVLRRAQGDPAGHHRDLPGDHPQVEGRVHAPGPVRLPRLGPGRSTTRCTCCPRRSSG